MTYGAMASPNQSGMLLEHRDARETLGKRRGGVVGASFKEVATCAYEVDPKAYFQKAIQLFFDLFLCLASVLRPSSPSPP